MFAMMINPARSDSQCVFIGTSKTTQATVAQMWVIILWNVSEVMTTCLFRIRRNIILLTVTKKNKSEDLG